MKVFIKSSRTLSLLKLLKRRKMTLKGFLHEQGITTFEGLLVRCKRLGVISPSENDFALTQPEVVTNPTEGVVVVEPIPVINEKSGKEIEVISPKPGLVDLRGIEVLPETPKRRRGRKKKVQEETSASTEVKDDVSAGSAVENVDQLLSDNNDTITDDKSKY